MPVTALQHRVIVGLFQSKIVVGKYCCKMDFIGEFVNFFTSYDYVWSLENQFKHSV